MLSSSTFYNIVRLPCLIEEGLKRSVLADVGEPAMPRQRLDPVLLLSFRRVWTEVDIDRAILGFVRAGRRC
jgi:hypothetical protein